MASLRASGWQLFDAIVGEAPLQNVNPWRLTDERLVYEPDYDIAERLLGVPVLLQAQSQSGVPALALDVWVSYEFRRAGFDPDRVWPRASAPRVLPSEITDFIGRLPKADQEKLTRRIADKGTGGSSVANLLGKNYVKQVDVVMSAWATGPELMVSTKRMDSSFGKNAANRVEESYGDAKNLRLRHPQAALGFVYALSAVALEREPDIAEWLIDLLGKLGREDDAYHAVALLLPDLTPETEAPGEDEGEEAGPLEPGATDGTEPQDGSGDQASPIESELVRRLAQHDVTAMPKVGLRHTDVPAELSPGRFFQVMCDRVLNNSPINFHREPRSRRQHPRNGEQ